MKKKEVAVLMGSDSDMLIVKETVDQLKYFCIEPEVYVASAHRTPTFAVDFAKSAKKEGFKVIIAAASLAAHLAGVIAANTTLPVIGLPLKSSFMGGLDSLLSTVQMPSGVPVATVAVNGAKNAAILAAQILALSNPEVDDKLEEMKIFMEKKVLEKNKNLKIL